MPHPPPPLPDQAEAEQLALQLDKVLTAQFTPVINRLTSDGIPPIIAAQAMMRLAAHIIISNAGERELRQTLAETLNVVLPRYSAQSSTEYKVPHSAGNKVT